MFLFFIVVAPMRDVVVIPTYNERSNIRLIVPEIFSVVPEIHVLVVDSNSPDGTADEVRSLMKAYPHVSLHIQSKKNGIGGAYMDGFKEILKDSSVDHVIMMDADFSHDPKYLPDLLRYSNEYDVVIGSRYVKGGGIMGWTWWRRILSFGATLYMRAILRKGIRDWTAGFNCMRANILRKIDLSSVDRTGYAFIGELKYLLILAGARIKEVPIILPNRHEGESKISISAVLEGIVAPWKLRRKGGDGKK